MTTEDQDIDPEREVLVRGLSREDLELLTDGQLEAVKDIASDRAGDKVRERVRAALADDHKAVLSSLTTPPFTYTSPEIRIAPGFEVRFTTLVHAQLRDAHNALDSFMRIERPNEIRMGDFFNRHLVAHSLSQVNGVDFAGITFDAEAFKALRASNQGDEMLKKVRETRLAAIDELSPHIVTRLVAYYNAFQAEVEAVTNDDDVPEALGN